MQTIKARQLLAKPGQTVVARIHIEVVRMLREVAVVVVVPRPCVPHTAQKPQRISSTAGEDSVWPWTFSFLLFAFPLLSFLGFKRSAKATD